MPNWLKVACFVEKKSIQLSMKDVCDDYQSNKRIWDEDTTSVATRWSKKCFKNPQELADLIVKTAGWVEKAERQGEIGNWESYSGPKRYPLSPNTVATPFSIARIIRMSLRTSRRPINAVKHRPIHFQIIPTIILDGEKREGNGWLHKKHWRLKWSS